MYVWQFYIPRQVMGSQTTLILYLAIVNDILQGRPCRRVGKINGQTGLKKKTTIFFYLAFFLRGNTFNHG